MVYSGSGGFSICTRRADLCDATLSLNNWQSVSPDRVVQVSIFKNCLMAVFSAAGDQYEVFNKNWSFDSFIQRILLFIVYCYDFALLANIDNIQLIQ